MRDEVYHDDKQRREHEQSRAAVGITRLEGTKLRLANLNVTLNPEMASKRKPADDADKDAFTGGGRGARQARSERRSYRGGVRRHGRGGKALSELEADPSRFNGLITDISLGGGPDGWEIARRARELIRNLPVVYISGHGSADWPSKGVPNSLTLGKPFATAQLITAISTLLVEADAHKAREG
jgi:hypothetical protein